jgi:hypothetical protein
LLKLAGNLLIPYDGKNIKPLFCIIFTVKIKEVFAYKDFQDSYNSGRFNGSSLTGFSMCKAQGTPIF